MTSQTPFLGILMLDTAFPRIPGDAGNINSYPFPAQIRCVTGAGSLDVVSASGPSDTLTEVFISAAQELKDEGAVGLVSTCGFLVHQEPASRNKPNRAFIFELLSRADKNLRQRVRWAACGYNI